MRTKINLNESIRLVNQGFLFLKYMLDWFVLGGLVTEICILLVFIFERDVR